MRFATNSVLVLAAVTLACTSSGRPPLGEPDPLPKIQPDAQAELVVAAIPVATEVAPTVEPVAPEEPSAAERIVQEQRLLAEASKDLGVMGGTSGELGREDQNVYDGLLVSLNVSSAKGALSSEATQAVMEMVGANLTICAVNGPLKHTNSLGVSLKLRFRINAKGNTSAVSLKGASKTVTSCMTRIVRNLQFEPSKKATVVAATISVEQAGFGAGGGTGYGTIGSASYGAIGHGGSGYGTASSARPQVRIGKSSAEGDLDKRIIRRYIRRQLPSVRYCYEKALLVKPKIAGTVVVKFQITQDGSVAKANAKGLDSDVSDCVAKTIRTIVFPKPKDGGIVKVRYPFAFMPANSATTESGGPHGVGSTGSAPSPQVHIGNPVATGGTR